mmetsp:Transcript_10048/g.13659  ORF Transcript_10048/g.13659 Transcript_10048/m.13659 type:complete len:426 (+) Transcript_10048:115-1392(+)
MVHVLRRMYCFHESLPLSRPPPVSFSPPNAPPISAPEVPTFTFTRPQSEPRGPIHRNTFFMSVVKMEDERPCGTELFIAMASSRDVHLRTCMIGTKSSVLRISASLGVSTIVASTKLPAPSRARPPTSTLPPCFTISSRPSVYSFTAALVCSGPRSVPSSSGSPDGIVPYAAVSFATTVSYTSSWMMRRRREVQRWPAVPTAPNTEARTAMSRSASGMITVALLPPSSRMVRPKRPWTTSLTCLPISEEPVKETRDRRLSLIMCSPTVRPLPMTMEMMAPSMPLASNTSDMIRVMAYVVRHVVDAPFQICVLPQMRERAEFQPATAQGKLKAVMMPTWPRGLYVSRSAWPGRSEGMTWPLMARERPTAKSQMSMNSWTSPMPSGLILPISRETRAPRATSFLRRASPTWRTISPRRGAGINCHSA